MCKTAEIIGWTCCTLASARANGTLRARQDASKFRMRQYHFVTVYITSQVRQYTRDSLMLSSLKLLVASELDPSNDLPYGCSSARRAVQQHTRFKGPKEPEAMGRTTTPLQNCLPVEPSARSVDVVCWMCNASIRIDQRLIRNASSLC